MSERVTPVGWEATSTDQLIREGALVIGDGYRAKNSEFVRDGGLPFIRVGDITNRIQTDARDELPVDQLTVYGQKVSQTDDCLITMKGTVGRVARVQETTQRFVYSPQISFWRVMDRSRVNPRFLRHWLQSPDFAEQSFATKSATDMADYINLRDQRRMRILLPPYAIQRRIAAFLSAFDELIEINERRIALLEDLARSLYQEWFVHFSFPGHEEMKFVDSELGAIPKGWAVRPLFEVSTVGFGFPFGSAHFAESGPFPVIRIRDVPRGVTTTFTDEEPQNHHLVRDGDVLVGMDGEFHLREWSGGDAWLNQRVARLRPSAGLSSRHLMLAVMGPIRAWNESISGTTVAHLGKRHLEAIRVVLPEERILNEAGAHFDHVAGSHLALIKKNRALATTRDLLLPRLVTGRLDISHLDLGDLLPADAA
jgi:type I restriction enzyme S subunit